MLLKFIHPTKKNVLIAFVICQLFPIVTLFLIGIPDRLYAWLHFELIILGALCLWELKPLSQLDEREMSIMLKWKARLLEVTSTMVLIPIVILSFKPEIEGWSLFITSAVPVYSAFVICTILQKRELGYFFYRDDITSE